ncbi:GNAT family N-acetyltransferase [Microbacterium sp. CFBP9034]|uniref:GNAT family N-acetyltransferase n=1 Tax=Microbacterium sp. CFBP9034 TaxID=3096540 RepID=UPI002A69CC2B|nr:GNAT family N-acetyltransferase [Microbacterium sp. CFBP9034]MDY0910776.1 GNAT family N-acetyltransferase [Microbacterium sp. CFBP9034]
MPDAHIRRVLASDGARLRALRLEALGDPAAGIAFLETRDEAAARPDEFWDERAVVAALTGSAAQFIAEAGPTWVGTVTVLVPEPGRPDYFGRIRDEGTALIVAVYIAPSRRGQGLLGELLDAAAEWAASQGCTELVLDVHEDNARARAAYARMGFQPTGGTIDGQNGRELEMEKRLDRA